jgi:hypothetical protein
MFTRTPALERSLGVPSTSLFRPVPSQLKSRRFNKFHCNVKEASMQIQNERAVKMTLAPVSSVGRLMLTLIATVTLLGGCLATNASRPNPPESLSIATPLPAPIGEVRKAFRAHYDEAIKTHFEKMGSSYPIVTQDLLNMTLRRPGAPPERFSMKNGAYMLMAHTSHPLLTVYSILSIDGFGSLSDARIKELTDYSALLTQAVTEIRGMNLPPSTLTRLTTVLGATQRFIAEMSARRSVSRNEFAAFAEPLRPLIRENFRIGANEQLVQFKEQMKAWKEQFPDEKWGELRVVVLGAHQARDLYALSDFFQWLVREPGYENRVVFAEFQGPISGPAREAAEAEADALKLLAKVDFEHEAAELIFGDRTYLQRDVMGPAAEEILKQWGTSDWPQTH